jgi:hypothetical protein
MSLYFALIVARASSLGWVRKTIYLRVGLRVREKVRIEKLGAGNSNSVRIEPQALQTMRFRAMRMSSIPPSTALYS